MDTNHVLIEGLTECGTGEGLNMPVTILALALLSLTIRVNHERSSAIFQICNTITFVCSVPCIEVPTNAQLRRCSAIQFYLLQQHVSVSLVTIFRVLYSKDTSNTLVIT